MSAKAYLLESLINPSAFIVEGYPPIMPAVDKPPIALNRSRGLGARRVSGDRSAAPST